MEKTVKQRLVEFLRHKSISQSAFERACGMSNGYINNLKSTIGVKKLQNVISAFPELNTEWLLNGEGTMLNNVLSTDEIQYMTRLSRVGGEVIAVSEEIPAPAPIVPTQLTTAPDTDVLEAIENADGGLEFSPIIAQGVDIKMWHRIKDTAMSPKYEPGDLLAIWPYEQGKERPIPGKPYVINTVSNGMVVRKLFPCSEGYIAKSLNAEDFPEFLIEKEEIVRIFRIIIAARM